MEALASLALDGAIYALLLWVMARDMRRRPRGGFFRPVLLAFTPIATLSVMTWLAAGSLEPAQLEKIKASIRAQAELFAKAGGASTELDAWVDLYLRIQPALNSVFALLVLTLGALVIRRRLEKRGQLPAGPPLSRWRSPDPMIWLLLLPGALLVLDRLGWLGQVEGGLKDGCLNLVLVMLAIYLFQGMMVALEKAHRLGLPKAAGAAILGFTVLAGALPVFRGLLLGVLAVGLLDLWMDFRQLNPGKPGGDERGPQ